MGKRPLVAERYKRHSEADSLRQRSMSTSHHHATRPSIARQQAIFHIHSYHNSDKQCLPITHPCSTATD